MNPHRIAVKLYLEDPAGLDPEELVPVFHRFIREDVVTGVPIDVARYGHVSDGPGIMIIGSLKDHALDLGGGRAGLSTTLKRGADGTVASRVVDLVQDVARLSVDLQADPDLGSRARVGTGEILITILDRYEAPNDDATLLKVDPAIREVVTALSDAGGAGAVTVERVGESRDPFAVRVLLDQPRPLIQWAEGVEAAAV